MSLSDVPGIGAALVHRIMYLEYNEIAAVPFVNENRYLDLLGSVLRIFDNHSFQ
jgi:hypothetical protein